MFLHVDVTDQCKAVNSMPIFLICLFVRRLSLGTYKKERQSERFLATFFYEGKECLKHLVRHVEYIEMILKNHFMPSKAKYTEAVSLSRD